MPRSLNLEGRIVEIASRSYNAGLIVLPTHRSNLDALVMPVVLYESHLPRTHTLAGINMAFWPIGPLSAIRSRAKTARRACARGASLYSEKPAQPAPPSALPAEPFWAERGTEQLQRAGSSVLFGPFAPQGRALSKTTDPLGRLGRFFGEETAGAEV